MHRMFWIGMALVLSGLAVLATGNLGEDISVAAIAGGGVLFVAGGTLVLSSRAMARARLRQATALRDLLTRGRRRTGTVRDVVAYAAPDGGAVVHAAGAQLVVHIDLARDGGGTQPITCHLVERTEDARARIGQEIVVIEHPDDPTLRAIDGFLPDGRPAQ